MEDNFKKNFGKKVKYYRTLANLSQEKLAELVGIAPNTVSYIERGKNSISFSKLPALCRALDILPQQLFCETLNNKNLDKISKINALLRCANEKQLNIFYSLLSNFLDL